MITILCDDYTSIFYGFNMVNNGYYWHSQQLKAAVNRQVSPDALTSRLKVHSYKQNFRIRTHIDLFICLTGRGTQWSGYNNRWCCNRERKGGVRVSGSWCASYFRNAGEETYWLEHLDLIRTLGLRGARQSLSTPLATVVQKYICCLPPFPFSLFRFLHFICLFLARGEKKSHLHQTKLWWAALSVQKTWGFDSSHSMVINYFSAVVGPPLPALSACCCSGSDGGWRQHMISAALITGLTGKRPRQHWANVGQSHTMCRMGPGKISRYMVFVYSLVHNGKVRCCQVCVWCWVK